MNRQTLRRLMIKGTVAYIAVFSLVLMVAMPAMALIAARNSVDRRAIINGEVTYKDLAKNSVRTAKIAPRAVRYGKIASGAVRTNHIKDGHVKSADIGNGTILNADISAAAAISASKINRAGLNADLLDGSHASAFAGAGHEHDSDYLGKSGPQNLNGDLTVSSLSYDATKTGYLAIPASALVPYVDGYDYERGDTLRMISGSGGFKAPVYLPQGAKITKFRYFAMDEWPATDYNTQANLVGIALVVGDPTIYLNVIASTPSSTDTTGWKVLEDPSVSGTIDNNALAYYVEVWLGGAHTSLRAGKIVIEYTYTSPGS